MFVTLIRSLTITLSALALLASPMALAAPGGGSCGDKVAAPSEASPASLKKAVIPVEGMTCGSCAGKVKTALMALDGVQAVNVDVAQGEAHVDYDEAKITIAAIVKAIADTGYKAGTPQS